MNPESDDEKDSVSSDEIGDDDNGDSENENEHDDPGSFFKETFDGWYEDVINSDSALINNEQHRISSMLKKCRRLTVSIGKSSVASAFMEQLRVELKVTRSMIVDCPTRWNSTHRLIDATLINKPVLVRFFAEFKHIAALTKRQQLKWIELELNPDDWTLLEILDVVLRPFYDATKLISSQKYPTIGICYFAISGIKDFLFDQSSSNQSLNVIKSLLLDQMHHYFDADRAQYQLMKVIAQE